MCGQSAIGLLKRLHVEFGVASKCQQRERDHLCKLDKSCLVSIIVDIVLRFESFVYALMC